MDFSWKSAILHAVYARASAAMPVACTAQQYIHSIWVLVLTHYLCEIAARTISLICMGLYGNLTIQCFSF